MSLFLSLDFQKKKKSNLQKFEYLENEKSFLDEMKNLTKKWMTV